MSDPRPVEARPGIVAAGCLVLVLCAVGAVAYWVLWSGPRLVVTLKGNAVEVSPLFLEYNLGVDEVELRGLESGVVAVRARRGEGNYLNGVTLTTKEDLLPQFRSAGWEVVTPLGGVAILQAKHSYRLRMRANNGFARWNFSTCAVDVGTVLQVKC